LELHFGLDDGNGGINWLSGNQMYYPNSNNVTISADGFIVNVDASAFSLSYLKANGIYAYILGNGNTGAEEGEGAANYTIDFTFVE